MQAFLGLGLIVGTIFVSYVLTPVSEGASRRPSWLDACVSIAGSSAIMIGFAFVISYLAGW